jgi:hypothetical protein
MARNTVVVASEPDPHVPSLARALLMALLLLVGAAIVLGIVGLIILTQLPDNFF